MLDLHNLSSLKTFDIPSPIEVFRDRLADGCILRVEELYVNSYSHDWVKSFSYCREVLIAALASLSSSLTRSVTPGLKQNNDPIWKFLRDRFIDHIHWPKKKSNDGINGQQCGNSDQDNGNNDSKVKPGDVEAGGGDRAPANAHQQPLQDEVTNNEDSESRFSDNMEELTPLDPPVHFAARFIVALIAASLLVAPVAVLSWQSTRRAHLITLAVSTTIFSFLASFSSKSSLQETMVAVAGYTAVLVVFVAVASTNP